MSALQKNRNTRVREGKTFDYGIGSGKHIYSGSLVNILASSGLAQPAGDNAGCVFGGVAISEADTANSVNTGNSDTLDPTTKVRLSRKGVYLFAKASAVQTDVGKTMYAVDDQTVDLVGVTTYDVPVGRCVGIEGTTAVWVAIDGFC